MLKKSKVYLLVIIAILTVLTFQSFVFAGELQEVDSEYVGQNITEREGFAKITSIQDNEEPVGNDIEISEGEMRIVSVESSSEAVVGEDIEIEEGEFKIISMPIEEEQNKTSYVKYIILGLALILGSSLFTIIYKKSTV